MAVRIPLRADGSQRDCHGDLRWSSNDKEGGTAEGEGMQRNHKGAKDAKQERGGGRFFLSGEKSGHVEVAGFA